MLPDLRLYTVLRNKGDYTEQSAFTGLSCRNNPQISGGLQSQLLFLFFIYVIWCRWWLCPMSFHSEIQAEREDFTWDMLFLWPRKSSWAGAHTWRLVKLPSDTTYTVFPSTSYSKPCSQASHQWGRQGYKTLQVTWQQAGMYNPYAKAMNNWEG